MIHGIPCALTDEEATLLAAVGAGRRVYEAGSLLGGSTLCLAATARSVVAVDPHDGYPRHDPSPTWTHFLHNLQRFDRRRVVVPHRAYFQQVAVDARVDFAWADLTGQLGLTREFLAHAHTVPVVALHDYSRFGCEGTTQAVDEYIRRTRPRRVIRAGTLVVIEK